MAQIQKLFVYGSLQQGGPNEHVLTQIGGDWEPAVIKGKLVESGWGAEIGFPALVSDDNAGEVSGYVFSSPNLDAHWDMLDAFEGCKLLLVGS